MGCCVSHWHEVGTRLRPRWAEVGFRPGDPPDGSAGSDQRDQQWGEDQRWQ